MPFSDRIPALLGLTKCTLFHNSKLDYFVSFLVSFLITLAFLAFFVQLLLAIAKWLVYRKNGKKVSGSKKQATSAVVGLLVVFSVWAIVSLIKLLFAACIYI